jgi:hypothetical protein
MTQNPILKNKILITIACTLIFVSLLLGGVFFYQIYFNNLGSSAQNSQIESTQSLANSSQNGLQDGNTSDNFSNADSKNSNISSNNSSNNNSNSVFGNQSQNLSSESQSTNQNTNQNTNSGVQKSGQNSSKTKQNIPQSYTNPYFPNLKINYDSSWKFETSTYNSSAQGLLDRKIVLTKNNTKISFSTIVRPPDGAGCYEIRNAIKLNEKYTRASFVNQSRELMGSQLYMKPSSIDCVSGYFSIYSNIKANSYPSYYNPYGGNLKPNDSEKVLYLLSINLDSQDEKLTLEADEIIKNSVFE